MGNRFLAAIGQRVPIWRSRRPARWLRQPGGNRTRLAVLAAGFVATLLVIAVVIGISLYSMGQIRASLEQLTEHVQRKMVEVASMRENLYLRIVSSRDMLLMTDVFDIDAEAQRFHVYPARIDAAYQRFRLFTTDPVEIELAEKFMNEAQTGLPLLNEYVALLMAKKHPDQIRPLIQQAFKTQKLGLETLLTLQDHLQNQSIRLTQEAVARYGRTRLLVVWLSRPARGVRAGVCVGREGGAVWVVSRMVWFCRWACRVSSVSRPSFCVSNACWISGRIWSGCFFAISWATYSLSSGRPVCASFMNFSASSISTGSVVN